MAVPDDILINQICALLKEQKRTNENLEKIQKSLREIISIKIKTTEN